MRKSQRISQHGTQNANPYDRTKWWTSPYANIHTNVCLSSFWLRSQGGPIYRLSGVTSGTETANPSGALDFINAL